MKSFRILLQPYQVPSFEVAIQKFNIHFSSSFKLETKTKELPIDDDGFVFFEVFIDIVKGTELALLYLGKFWGYES
jgi:hypothetical protein